MLPTGYCQQLLARACQGELLDAYAMADFGQLAYLMTREDDEVRVLLSNLQPQSLRVKLPRFGEVSIAVFRGEVWNSTPSDELDQPYGIAEESAESLGRIVAPPFSVVLIEGRPAGG